MYPHSYADDNAKFILLWVNVLTECWTVYIKIDFDVSKTKASSSKETFYALANFYIICLHIIKLQTLYFYNSSLAMKIRRYNV